jgi:hypothetical protein
MIETDLHHPSVQQRGNVLPVLPWLHRQGHMAT